MQEVFARELIESGYVHSPLPLHPELSLEAENAGKEVLKEKILWDETDKLPELSGIGTLRLGKKEGKESRNILCVTAPTARNTAPYEDGATAGQFRSVLIFRVPKENWESYNRISLWVRPDSPGSHSVHIRLFLYNDGEKKIPDAYWREGQHLANLENHVWNQVIWEFGMLPRDCVTQFAVSMDADGQDTATGSEFYFEFDRPALQRVLYPVKEKGWTCDERHIACSLSGYHCNGAKTAIANTGYDTFSVLRDNGTVVLQKEVRKQKDRHGYFEILDFSEVTEPGMYRLQCGCVSTPFFEIGEKVMERVIWKALNFIFCERCGFPIPGKHGRCHRDVTAEHNGVLLPFCGGWHDVGDMSQQMLQTAEVAQELLELARRVNDDTLLAHRLTEEGLWGLEFVLNCRFGDGYRASSVGLGLWTDGLIGNIDDVKARVHNQAFQNFFCAAVEADAALTLGEVDPELAWKCLQAAKEDYWFAKRRFQEKGMERPVMWEHTLNSGLSQYYAAAAWAAATILRLEKDPVFEREAVSYGRLLLACQETGTKGVPLRGFFYRDETHQTIVHYSHQGREHSFVQALATLCRALPDSGDRPAWERGIRLYGEYSKTLFAKAVPYGMIPAGIYSYTEVEDADTFSLLHLLVDYEAEKKNYTAQLDRGEALGNGYVLKMFPVWFSFRGNSAIQLSMAKAAAIAGNYLQDESLLEIAREQLYWMSGKNPFCQSLIYGEGARYGQQDANYPGEMTGEMPVGIETYENEDDPYWPSGNNATYKEVWLTTAGRWLSVIAELYPGI